MIKSTYVYSDEYASHEFIAVRIKFALHMAKT